MAKLTKENIEDLKTQVKSAYNSLENISEDVTPEIFNEDITHLLLKLDVLIEQIEKFDLDDYNEDQEDDDDDDDE